MPSVIGLKCWNEAYVVQASSGDILLLPRPNVSRLKIEGPINIRLNAAALPRTHDPCPEAQIITLLCGDSWCQEGLENGGPSTAEKRSVVQTQNNALMSSHPTSIALSFSHYSSTNNCIIYFIEIDHLSDIQQDAFQYVCAVLWWVDMPLCGAIYCFWFLCVVIKRKESVQLAVTCHICKMQDQYCVFPLVHL